MYFRGRTFFNDLGTTKDLRFGSETWLFGSEKQYENVKNLTQNSKMVKIYVQNIKIMVANADFDTGGAKH